MIITNNNDKQIFIEHIDRAIAKARILIAQQNDEVSTESIGALVNIRNEVADLELIDNVNAIDLREVADRKFWRSVLDWRDFTYFNLATIQMLVFYGIIDKPSQYDLCRIDLRDAIHTLLDDNPFKAEAHHLLTQIHHERLNVKSLPKQDLAEALYETRKLIAPKNNEPQDLTVRTENFNRYVNNVKWRGRGNAILGSLCMLGAIACLAAMLTAGVCLLPCAGAGLPIIIAGLLFAGAICSTFGGFNLFTKSAAQRQLADSMSLIPKPI